jgi:hypothetical protein
MKAKARERSNDNITSEYSQRLYGHHFISNKIIEYHDPNNVRDRRLIDQKFFLVEETG